MAYVETSDDCGKAVLETKFQDGYTYYTTIQAINGAGLWSLLASRPLIVDTSPPVAGYVYDEIQPDAQGDDIDYITTQSVPSVRWQGFHDPHSSIKHYKVRVGTYSGGNDIMQETEAGTNRNFTLQQANLIPGKIYFTTVTGCNMADMCTSISSDGFIIDVTPPVAGRVLDGTRDTDVDFQSLRNYIGSKWNGFKDIESGIGRYVWRVGTSKGGDELFKDEDLPVVEITYRSSIPDNKLLPVGTKIYITIRAYNKAGLYSEATSNGFIVDITLPFINKQPILSSSFASLKSSTSICRSSIKVEWKFTDDESDIERQYISISSHLMGEFNSSFMEIPSVLEEYIFTNLNLHDGSKYRINIIGCNLAGLCRSDSTGDILVDSSPPSRGTFAIETDHAANLARYRGKWIEWNTTTITVAWLGFSDLHTGINHYLISVGTKPFFTDTNKERVPVKVIHEKGFNFNEEDVIQITTVESSHYLQHGTSIFIAIWAVNGVGLKSLPIHSEFQLVHADYRTEDRGSLVRRCQPYNCDGHCVCGEQDKTCSVQFGCIDLSQGNPNTLIEVTDVTNLMSTESIQRKYTSSNMFLSARWNIITVKGLQPIRYEVSFGKADDIEPNGIFDVSTERVWFDVGQNMVATLTLANGKLLDENIPYSVFVKVWYDEQKYAIFKSPGITVITLVPKISNIAGSAVKELKSVNDSNDIDYQISSTDIIVSWKNKFNGGIHGLDYYKAYISTHPIGHNIHQGSVSVTETSYVATGLNLEENRVFYSTVLAYNKAGLVSWVSSDGIAIDNTPPSAGIIRGGDGMYNIWYQSSEHQLRSSWYGFSDNDSGIVKYYWCVGTNDDITTCNIHDWKDVGLNIQSNMSSTSSIYSDKKIFYKVYCEDKSGLHSSVSVSNGIIIDNTPPQPIDFKYTSENKIINPSFEQISTSETNEACDNALPINWNTDPTSCVQPVHSQTTVSKDGRSYIKVQGQISQRVTNLKIDAQYQVVLHVGYPHDVSPQHHMVEGFVRLGDEFNTFKLDPDLCQGICNLDHHGLIYWYKFTYIYCPNSTTEEIVIGTTKYNMILAVDDVQLHEVNYISIDGDVNHIVHHALFRPTWSSLHLNWHFKDDTSQIIDYEWALGMVKGGTQIKEFSSEGRRTHVTVTNIQFTHNTNLYITVKATNGAGLYAVSKSERIIVDMTPPIILQINDGLGSDVKVQLTKLVSVNWEIEDPESGIDYCEWAIGTSLRGTEVQIFSPVPRDQSLISAELKNDMKDLNIKIYSTVRCYNKAGLHVTAASDGVVIVNHMDSGVNGQLTILTDGTSIYNVDSQCQPLSDSVRLKWNTESPIDTLVYVVGISSDEITIKKEIKLIDVCYNSAKLTSLKLQQDMFYNISISAVNILRRLDTTLFQHISTNRKPPSVKDGSRAQLTKSLDGKAMIITWKDVFMSEWEKLYYEVSLGSSPGRGDIIQWQETEAVTITVNYPNNRPFSKLFLIVTAVDPCGLHTIYNSDFNI